MVKKLLVSVLRLYIWFGLLQILQLYSVNILFLFIAIPETLKEVSFCSGFMCRDMELNLFYAVSIYITSRKRHSVRNSNILSCDGQFRSC